MQKVLADDTFCACIATAVDFSIQVQMNQWKIVWLPVWKKCDILSGVVLYLIRVVSSLQQCIYFCILNSLFILNNKKKLW